MSNGGPTKPTAPYFKNGIWGWDGSQWRRLPLVWGFSEGYIERVMDDGASAGTNALVGETVPAGEVWVVKAAGAFDVTSIVTKIRFRIYDGSIYLYLLDSYVALANEVVSLPAEVVLAAGWRLEAVFYGCVAGDDLYFDITGYKMAVAE